MKIGDLIFAIIPHQNEHGPLIVDDPTFDQGSHPVIQSLSHHFLFLCVVVLFVVLRILFVKDMKTYAIYHASVVGYRFDRNR